MGRCEESSELGPGGFGERPDKRGKKAQEPRGPRSFNMDTSGSGGGGRRGKGAGTREERGGAVSCYYTLCWPSAGSGNVRVEALREYLQEEMKVRSQA